MNINDFPSITFSYFDTTINKIDDFLRVFFKEKIENNKTIISRVKSNEFKALSECCLKAQQSYNIGSYEALFYNPSICKDKTIMISNLTDGWFTLCNVISHNLECSYYLFTIDDRVSSEPSNSFRYVNKDVERVVYSMKDGKWIFYSEGVPLFFEDEKNYKKRIIKERLTKQILIEYCNLLGLRVDENGFWFPVTESLMVKNPF